MNKKLYRSRENKIIAGVAGGLAEYFDIDPVIVRVIFVVTAFGWGFSFFAYLLLWIIVPKSSFIYTRDREAENSEPIPQYESIKENTSDNARKHNGKIAIALILIVIGILGLLHNLFPYLEFKFVFPVILIIAGILILIKFPGFSEKKKNGEAL